MPVCRFAGSLRLRGGAARGLTGYYRWPMLGLPRSLRIGAAPTALAVLFALAGLAIIGCHSTAPPMHPVGAAGRWYTVVPGETLGDIARRAGVPEEDLLEANGLHSASEVKPGKLIFVLDKPPPVDQPLPPAVAATEPEPPVESQNEARFRWPVEAPRVTSFFGARWGRAHEGIDLNAAIGTPVFAAGTGEVVYASNKIRGYGNMIVLKHDQDLMTVYAHNSVLLVKVGDHVTVGARVALSGQSGHATGPHVHFEVRRGQVPRNPLPYLPDLHLVRKERTPKS
jgi:murein DD-endopeptidase MepM/ murein hydrolase activator NlpD